MTTPSATQVDVHYVKSAVFRVIHVDGSYCDLTPTGLVHMALFSQRKPIPQTLVHPISSDGRLEAPTGMAGKSGILREIEVGAMMSPQVAREIAELLIRQADLLEKLEAGVEP